jgi:transposase
LGIRAQVHDSGQSHWTGHITKSGRRDLRRVMVDAARQAAQRHPHWKACFQVLAARIGRPKAIVTIALKLG